MPIHNRGVAGCGAPGMFLAQITGDSVSAVAPSDGTLQGPLPSVDLTERGHHRYCSWWTQS